MKYTPCSINQVTDVWKGCVLCLINKEKTVAENHDRWQMVVDENIVLVSTHKEVIKQTFEKRGLRL